MKHRDMTDNYMRRCLRVLGFKGQYLPMSIAEVVVHPNRPGESACLRQGEAESRRDAVERLRKWAFPEEAK